MKCDNCKKGVLRETRQKYMLLGEELGTYGAMRCDSCNEVLFNADSLDRIQQKAKEKGIWGLAAKTRIGTSGNALDVKIPKAIVEFLNLEKGQEVLIEPVDKKTIKVAVIE